MPEPHPSTKDFARRNERDVRLVQAAIGLLGGVVVGSRVDMRLMSHWYSSHGPTWLLAVIPIVGAIAGAAAGYHIETWRSALGR